MSNIGHVPEQAKGVCNGCMIDNMKAIDASFVLKTKNKSKKVKFAYKSWANRSKNGHSGVSWK